MRLNRKTSLIKDHEGAAAIEFALVFPVMLLLTMGILEFGLIMHVNSLVDNATQEAARLGITGNTYGYADRSTLIDSEIRERVGFWLKESDQLKISTQVVASGITTISPEDPYALADINNGYGVGGEAVIYKVDYAWKVLTPLMAEIIGDDDGKFAIHAVAVVKNEAF